MIRMMALAWFLFLWAWPSPALSRDPPAAHCFDAHEIREMWQSDAQTLAIRLANGDRYRMELADACDGATHGDRPPSVLARGGWVCGSNEERLKAGARECAVSGIARIDARQFADLARQANDPSARALSERVEVRGERQRSFRGSTAYCFGASHVRGWSMDADGLVIDVSPQRSGGNTHYRVELADACTELAYATHLRLHTSVGQGAICGNAGDRVFPMFDALPLGGGVARQADSARPLDGAPVPGHVQQIGCRVSRVYPLERD